MNNFIFRPHPEGGYVFWRKNDLERKVIGVVYKVVGSHDWIAKTHHCKHQTTGKTRLEAAQKMNEHIY